MQPQQEAVGGRVHSEESPNRSCCGLREPDRGLHQQRHVLQQAPPPHLRPVSVTDWGVWNPRSLGHSILGKTDPTSPCIINEQTGAGEEGSLREVEAEAGLELWSPRCQVTLSPLLLDCRSVLSLTGSRDLPQRAG